MSSHSPKIWQPLNIAQREIRLLLLDPSSEFAAPLSGRLSTVSLNDKPSFDAISHAWGRASDIRTLSLDGKVLMITIEVEACLRHLRHKAYIRALWVDAVCIDQQDLMERGSQVEFMRYIFRQAAVVHVWLGYRTRQIEELMEDIARAPSSEHYAKNIWDADAKQAHRSLDLEVSLLLSQDWWSRLWIRQEVALAKIVRLHYGKNSAELQQLKHWALTTKTLDCDGDAYVACVYQINALTTLREIVLLRNRDELVILLAESRESSVADARDRVYGQLEFVSAILQEDIMRTDYTLSTEQVFTNFAFSLMRSCRSLDILNQPSSQYNSIHALPTWVPDWTSRYSFVPEKRRLAYYTDFRATAGRAMPEPRRSRLVFSSIESTVDLLGVRGHVFAMCQEVGPACEVYSVVSTAAALSRLILSEWLPRFRGRQDCYTGTQGSNRRTLSTVATNVDAQFAATMLRGLLWRQDRDHPERIQDDSEAVPLFHTIMEACTVYQPTSELDELSDSMTLFMDGLRRTRFFIDSDGRPGLGPTNIEPGDVLALLLGGDMPYVLRRDESGREPSAYKFIGECYVHEAMDGELFDEDLVQDIWLV